jgi:hypothetical protein
LRSGGRDLRTDPPGVRKGKARNFLDLESQLMVVDSSVIRNSYTFNGNFFIDTESRDLQNKPIPMFR